MHKGQLGLLTRDSVGYPAAVEHAHGHGDDRHSRFDGMAVEHVLGGLGEDDGRLFRAHLLDCGTCRAHVGELRAIAHELADVERNEARARAVQQLETKQREEDDEPAQSAPSAPQRRLRSSQLVVGALLGVVIILSAWLFILRGQVGELEQQLDASRDIIAAPGAEDRWDLATADGITGELRENGDALVVMADALPDVSIELTAYGADDSVLLEKLADVDDGHFLALLRDLDEPLERVTLTAPALPDDEAILLEASVTD